LRSKSTILPLFFAECKRTHGILELLQKIWKWGLMYTLQHLRYGDKKMVDINLRKIVPSFNAIAFQGIEKMKTCEECGNKLGILGRYFHPLLGRKHIVCGTCCLKYMNLIEQWRTFVHNNPKIIDSLDIDCEKLKNNFESTVTSIMKSYVMIANNEQIREYPNNMSEQSILITN
jgi:hypothetical protein